MYTAWKNRDMELKVLKCTNVQACTICTEVISLFSAMSLGSSFPCDHVISSMQAYSCALHSFGYTLHHTAVYTAVHVQLGVQAKAAACTQYA